MRTLLNATIGDLQRCMRQRDTSLPHRRFVQPSRPPPHRRCVLPSHHHTGGVFCPATTTTTASQPSTAAPQPPTTAGISLGRDKRAYKTVVSWELGGGVKASVVQSSDGGEFVNIRQFTSQNRPTMDGVCMSATTWDFFSETLIDFRFGERTSSFISNNSVIALSEEGRVCLQNLQKSSLYCKEVHKLKAYDFKLNSEQMNVLKTVIFDVSECLTNLQ
ncbi:hypothetical protein AVEN_227712-1 [Araneus ventricosus]|uniref:Uncharacterized protein n=1 Tax=Araneus ventricosus TaxID=182803 RepID=A0A4Y2EKU8_ARAVE|nr:hypothetical protein AVEN_227712-1 [Araneus ventricosus]